MKLKIDGVEITFNLNDHSYSYPVTTTLDQITLFFNDSDFNLLRDFTFAHYNKINNIPDYEHDYYHLQIECSKRFPKYVNSII